jgi:hypothetical protein
MAAAVLGDRFTALDLTAGVTAALGVVGLYKLNAVDP